MEIRELSCDDVKFSATNAIILSQDVPIYLCPMSNRGEVLASGKCCQYSLCNDCMDEHTPKCRCPPDAKRSKSCNHNMKALVRSEPAWWCADEFRGQGAWKSRAQGCVVCKKMYILKK